MTGNESLITLMLAAATVGSLHSVAPDHWVPFSALARSRGWSRRRTARVTLLCGFGHVSVTALLGVIAIFIGLRGITALGSWMAEHATIILMVFGMAYMSWGLWRSFRRDPLSVMHHHHHHHVHGENDHDHGLTEWSLFLLFSADPCVAVLPMIVAASTLGWAAVGAVVLVYEIATIGAMIALVLISHAGFRVVRFRLLDRYGDAIAGALILIVGALLVVFET